MTSSSPTKRLFVGSLPYRFTEGELLTIFAPFGRIVSLRIMHNKWGKSRGIGYVEYDQLESAIQAKEKLHHLPLGDRTIIVDYAQPDPFLTSEGLQRHEEALSKRKPKRVTIDQKPASRPVEFKPRQFKTKYDPNARQSVYDSRHHHSSVGKKFASRSKKK